MRMIYVRDFNGRIRAFKGHITTQTFGSQSAIRRTKDDAHTGGNLNVIVNLA